MSEIFLTREGVAELTGRKQSRAPALALAHLRVVHKTRADGKPLVLRAHIEQLFAVGIGPTKKAAAHFEPNWVALKPRPELTRKKKKR